MSGPEKQWAPVERVSSMRPEVAPGTPCAPCNAKGHFCAGFEIVDGRAVCIHCLDGVPCMRAPRGQVARDSHLPDPKQATKAVAAHESIAATMPQPALARGAEPSAAMPPRRVFFGGKTGICSRGCGGQTHRGQCKRASVGDAVKRVESKVLVKSEATLKDSGAKLEKTIAVRTEAKPVAELQAGGLSAKSIADGYKLMSLQDVPGRKPASVYESIVADLATLPVNSVLTRTYANKQIAHTFMCGITRMARQRKLQVSQVQDGATIYVWLKA